VSGPIKLLGTRCVQHSEVHRYSVPNEELVAALQRALGLPSNARIVITPQSRLTVGDTIDLGSALEAEVEVQWVVEERNEYASEHDTEPVAPSRRRG
jgi:hypothetical protein